MMLLVLKRSLLLPVILIFVPGLTVWQIRCALILEKIANVDNTHKESVRLLNRRFDDDIKIREIASVTLNNRITAISTKAI